MTMRKTTIKRQTLETDIDLSLNLDGTGAASIETGIGFLNHMLTSLARHGRFDLEIKCKGDLEVDSHHTAEDIALVLGSAFDELLDDRAGITRFGYAYAPLDEALARAVVDFSGRPSPCIDLGLRGERIGGLECENITHVLQSFANACKAAIHVDVLKGENDHHRAEAAFKALALALRQAVGLDGTTKVPSTKGVL
jgi:imidazoleglycerol-phosphate dehydratase